MLDPRPTQSGTALATSPKGPLAHPGVLLSAGVAVLLGAYALGYIPQFGGLLEDAIRSSHSAEALALGPAVYGIAGLAAFLILLGMLRSADLLLRKLRVASPLRSRPTKPVEQFIEEAAAAGISLRVARECYYLLEPQYPHRMCISLGDNLRSDLALSEEDVAALVAMLRARSDRRSAPVHSVATDAGDNVRTLDERCASVQELLHLVETSPPLRRDRSGPRERAPEVPVESLPMPERRLSDSAQRKALHAATLAAIEDGSLHTAQTSALHRRASDYSGPRRRATDNRIDPDFKGPFRRATDLAAAERHAANRVVSPSTEPRPLPLTDPAQVNRRDLVSMPLRTKRPPEPRRTV